MDKHERLAEAVDEIGEGEVRIKIRDGRWLISIERWKRNPSQLEIHQAIDDTLEWAFRGLEQQDIGEIVLKQIKRIRLE
jgi:hypothetical protein